MKKNISNSHLKRIGVFFITITLLVILWTQRDSVIANPEYGYVGIFIVSFISSATILFPLPGAASIFVGGSIWNPLLVGIVSAIGATAGELFGYLLGYGSKELILQAENRLRWMKRIEYFFHKAGFVTILVYSALPLPLFDIVGILAGTLNYPVWKFALATCIGRIIKHILIAAAGNKILPG